MLHYPVIKIKMMVTTRAIIPEETIAELMRASSCIKMHKAVTIIQTTITAPRHTLN